MNKHLLPVILLLPAWAGAGEPSFDAERFHRQHCTACHDSGVYTRPDRRVHSRQQLRAQVRRCDASLGIRLFDDDLEALVDYLDRQFYRLDR